MARIKKVALLVMLGLSVGAGLSGCIIREGGPGWGWGGHHGWYR